MTTYKELLGTCIKPKKKNIYIQGVRGEKDGNRSKFIGSDLVIFCFKEFGKFVLCEYFRHSEAIFILRQSKVDM